ncbi:MAG: ATP synthase F1 subunit delta [Candidatus Omnitrophica bacterium]|nr:ATP synthase F1 subunit delta [Candidatus Omnitrophota bacterium]
MPDSAVAVRYAEAYVSACEQAGRLDDGLEELKGIAQTYTLMADLRRFLGSPEIAEEEKGKLLGKVFSERTGPQGMGLLNLLLKKDRMDHVPLIAQEAVLAAEKRRGILKGELTTARPILVSEREAVTKAVERFLKKKVVLETRVDPKILGGIRVRVGTLLFDGSVESLLNRAKRYLLEVKVA